jgi:hypothetical protein
VTLPPRRHACKPVDVNGVKMEGGIMQRCACGAARFWDWSSALEPCRKRPAWHGKNSNRLFPDLPTYRRPRLVALIKRMAR